MMGVFGVQLVLTMIIASFLHKISPYYSLGRWIVTSGIHYYLPPSDKTLRPHVVNSGPQNKTNKKKVANYHDKVIQSPSNPTEISSASDLKPLDSSMVILKSANFKLLSSPLKDDFELLRFSSDLEFMINLTFASLVVFCMTAVYYYLQPVAMGTEYNLSVIWLTVLIVYSVKALVSLTRIYLSEELAHQRSLILVFTALFFVCALGVLLIDESVLDFGLEKSHRDVTKSLSILLEGVMKESKDIHLLSMWSFKMTMALFCGAFSMILIFPGFRFADTHFNTISSTRTPFFRSLLNVNYIAPMLCLSLWIRPLTHEFIADKSNVNIFNMMEIRYESFRVLVLLGVCIFRFALTRHYLQNYLNTAKWRVENLRQEQRRLTIQTLRKKVSHIFLFYAALGIQYLAPYVILLSVTLLLCASTFTGMSPALLGRNENVLRLSGLGISSFQGCIGFFCWWLCFTNVITSGFGAVLKEFI